MKNKVLLLFFFSATLAQAAPPVEEGKTIFTTRCAGCHQVNRQVVGPALAGVDQRRSLDWIISFVHSSQTLAKNGDKEAVALLKQFNNIPMPDHKDLSDENIKNVVAYIQAEAGAAAAKKALPAQAAAPAKETVWQTIAGSPAWLFTLATLILLLAASFLLWSNVAQQRRQAGG